MEKTRKRRGTSEERMQLVKKMFAWEATSSELVRLSYLIGMINEKEYDEYLELESLMMNNDQLDAKKLNKYFKVEKNIAK